jgi:hypothetical protein
MKKLPVNLLFIIAAILFSCSKHHKQADPVPVCYHKSEIVGKHLKNYQVNNVMVLPEKDYYFTNDSILQNGTMYPVTYTAGFDSIYVYYTPTAVSKYFIEVNNCSEFAIVQGAYTTYLR